MQEVPIEIPTEEQRRMGELTSEQPGCMVFGPFWQWQRERWEYESVIKQHQAQEDMNWDRDDANFVANQPQATYESQEDAYGTFPKNSPGSPAANLAE